MSSRFFDLAVNLKSSEGNLLWVRLPPALLGFHQLSVPNFAPLVGWQDANYAYDADPAHAVSSIQRPAATVTFAGACPEPSEGTPTET